MTVSSVRRSRGYNWESTIVKRLQKCGYAAYRLGGTTTSMPDIVAWPLGHGAARPWSRAYSIECKSTVNQYAYVPAEQIKRIRRFAEEFPITCFPIVSVLFRNPKTGRKISEHHVRAPGAADCGLPDVPEMRITMPPAGVQTIPVYCRAPGAWTRPGAGWLRHDGNAAAAEEMPWDLAVQPAAAGAAGKRGTGSR